MSERERERERENNQFSLENVRGNSKFIENKIRRKKKSKNKRYGNEYQIIQVMLCNIFFVWEKYA